MDYEIFAREVNGAEVIPNSSFPSGLVADGHLVQHSAPQEVWLLETMLEQQERRARPARRIGSMRI
jgi:hypothetical protein